VGYIKATLHTEKLRGNVGRGITVQTDDPATPTLRLTIRAEVVGSVLVLPAESLMFNNVSPRQNRTRLLVRRDPTETGDLKVGDVEPSADWFSITATRLEQPLPASVGLPAGQPGDWLLEGELAGNPSYGVTRAEFSFTTGLARQPTMSLPVLANLRPPVHLASEPIELTSAGGEVPEATVLFSIRSGLDPEELRIESEPEALEVQVEQAGRRFYKAQLRWAGGEFGGGTVVFSLGEESYRVPVRPAAPAPGR
jgi:hypothetical protein